MLELESSQDQELLAFETNAQLWRLEVHRFANALSEQAAFGTAPDQALHTGAMVALDGIEMEIGRFQTFATSNPDRPLDALVRLAEVAVALQAARTRLTSALKFND